jgi:RHS repeat-associated protein
LNTETYGNGLIHGIDYNNRLQATQIKLGTAGSPTSVVSLGYSYGGTNNNGNVLTHTYSGGGLSYTQSFGYDPLNRLTTSSESGSSWSQTNGYDRYGNRWIDLGSGSQSLYFNASNNRITGWNYDAASNLLNDGAHSYSYDAENKITDVDSVSAYIYDGAGQRVRKLVGENLRFVYGVRGELIAEFSGSTGSLLKEYIYGASGLLATIEPTAVNSNGTRYTTPDHLGSPRVVTNSGASVISRHDYMPFGEELGAGVGGRTMGMGFPGISDGLRQKFTKKERDNETGLDYFINRYYSSAQGRFTSVDPLLGSGDTANPQTWNRYAYVVNNPTRLVDRYGLDDEDPQDPAKTQPNVPPCKQPKSVTITTGPPRIAAGEKLPRGDYFTGPVSVFSIEVKDSEGNTIKDGVTVQESAVPADDQGLDLIQNPHPMAPLESGIIPDYVGIGETSKQPYDKYNPKDREHAGNVIETALSRPITTTARQTLTVSGCGTSFEIVNDRTQTNVVPGTGEVKPYKQNGRLVNNYTYSLKAISGPVTVVNKPPK